MSYQLQDQLQQFLTTLFRKDDVVEIRPIEIWTDGMNGQRRSRVLRHERRWQTPAELSAGYSEMAKLNLDQRANIFMGVNSRTQRGVGRKCDVRICRCIWADMDDVSCEVARWRCSEMGLPHPSIVVDSGNGVHLYWLLDRAIDVSNAESRQQFESRLKALYRQLGCDATSDVNRLLRLPGFWNMKDGRNGSPPRACRLLYCDADRRCEIDHFAINVNCQSRQIGDERSNGPGVTSSDGSIQQVLACLDKEVSDRSRRDFAVVCSLLRLGMGPPEIWSHVANRSKFVTRGYDYFKTTVNNALEATAHNRGT